MGALVLLSTVGIIAGILLARHSPQGERARTHPGDAVRDVPTPALELPHGSRIDQYQNPLRTLDGASSDAPWDAAPAHVDHLDSLRIAFYREVESTHNDPYHDSLYAQLKAITHHHDSATSPPNSAQEDSLQYATELAYLEKAMSVATRYNTPRSVSPKVSPVDSLAAARAEPTPIPREPVSKTAPRAPRLQPDSAARIPPDSTARRDSVAPPRRAGFYGFSSGPRPVASNSTRAVVDQTVTISPGEYVRLRLLEPLPFRGVTLPAGSVVVAQGSLQGNRMRLYVERLVRDGYIFSAALSAFDLDGLEGIFVPGSAATDAARETVAQLGQQSTTGFTFSQSAKDAVATELASTAIQGVSKYLGGRIRAVRLRLKAGHRVYLVPRGPGE